MGVILFAMLCGRLPFDEYFVGDDQSSKRRRNSASAIQSRIQRGLYKPDVDLSIEAKVLMVLIFLMFYIPLSHFDLPQDLIKRLLAVDPAERCTLPEALSHPWMRMIFSDLPSRGTGDTGAVSEQPLVLQVNLTKFSYLRIYLDFDALQAELVESLSTSAGNRRDSDASSAASRDSSARTSEVNAALVDGGAPAVDGIQGQLKINSVELSATPVLNDPAPKAGMIVLQRLRDPATCTADNDDDDDEAEEAAAARATERIRNVLKSTLDAGTANSTGSGTPQSAGVKPKRGNELLFLIFVCEYNF
jgi:serine/threonine protein kinase